MNLRPVNTHSTTEFPDTLTTRHDDDAPTMDNMLWLFKWALSLEELSPRDRRMLMTLFWDCHNFYVSWMSEQLHRGRHSRRLVSACATYINTGDVKHLHSTMLSGLLEEMYDREDDGVDTKTWDTTRGPVWVWVLEQALARGNLTTAGKVELLSAVFEYWEAFIHAWDRCQEVEYLFSEQHGTLYRKITSAMERGDVEDFINGVQRARP